MSDKLLAIGREIEDCERCGRLRQYCAGVARTKRRAYMDWEYWGRPVPGFGDPRARLFILGLAPGAHGANRTGRVFTGDKSGDWLYRAMWQTGFANQPTSRDRADGLELRDAWVSASVRCAPPDNKPTREEIAACRPFLERELAAMPRVRVVVALGRLAFDNYLAGRRLGLVFGHDAEHHLPGADEPVLISSYHPSQQNTSTGKLTEAMLRAVFERARRLLG